MQPQSLYSHSVNPVHLLEIQVLSQVVHQLQSKNDIRGSIPYLAKIVQIIDNQRLEKTNNRDLYFRQLNEYRKVQSRAHFDLAEAYFKTHDFILSEASFSIAVKNWEKLMEHEEQAEVKELLSKSYDYLKTCYEAMGKDQLAYFAEVKKNKLMQS